MPDHRIRAHPIGAPQLRQRQLQPHQHRLHPRIPTHRLPPASTCCSENPTSVDESRLQLGHRRGEHRLIGQQPPTHPGPLRTLTRIHKHRARPARPHMRTHHPLGRPARRQSLQPRHRLRPIPRTHRGEPRMAGPMMIERMGHISQPHSTHPPQPSTPPTPPPTTQSAPRTYPTPPTCSLAGRVPRHNAGSGRRRLLNHHMRIRTGQTERRHPRPPRTAAVRP